MAQLCFLGVKREKGPLKTIKRKGFLISPTPSLSWGSALPIHYPKGAAPSQNATKNTTKINRFGLTVSLWVKSRTAPLKPSNVKPLSFFLPCHPPRGEGGGTSPSHHARGTSHSLKATKNTSVISRFGLAVFFIGNEGNSPPKTNKH